jgi:signal transduction histidine kinase/CheY-like chemotaxis protein
MVGLLKKRVANKILVAMAATIVLIMGAEIIVRIYFGTRDRIELINMSVGELASSTYAGMKHPMAVGDAQAISEQMADIRETARGVEVFICDFEQEIIYSTHQEKLRTRLADSIGNASALQAMGGLLESGIGPESFFEDQSSGHRCFVYLYPILNQEECHHCHGRSRKVLGGMAIRMGVERALETVAAQRNRTILLTLIGVFLVVLVTYLIVNRWIRHPVEEIAEQARRFAEGDMTVAVSPRTEDEIGVLGGTFNAMVGAVSSARKTLEEEIARKSALLSERSRLITLLEKANRELRQMDQLKSTFLANMSHELRTPMNSIIGYTDLLIDGVDGPVNADQATSLKKIASNSRYLLQLINDILDISRIESGRMPLNPKEIDLKWLIESAIPTFEPLLKQKQLTLTYQVDSDVSTTYGDEDALRQVLMNLLSNAVKFTRQGGIAISGRISERGREPGGEPIFAEICVQDSGIGIKEEDLGSIFDKFVQVDLTTVRQHEGTGLGLSIARGLVALHKGMIWATSVYGEGSRFCFTVPLTKGILETPGEAVSEPRMAEALAEYFGVPPATFLREPRYAGRQIRCWHYVRCGQPSCPAYGSDESRCWLILGTHCAGLKIASYPEKVDFCKGCELIENIILKEDEEAVPLQAITAAAPGGSRRVVLAVDDNPEGIDIIRKYLGEAYTVVGLMSGADVVAQARATRPLAITLDILMPHKDGWQVLRELKENPDTQDIPVIIISIVEERRLAFSLGAAEYLVKPVPKEVLLRKLGRLEGKVPIGRVLIVDHEAETVRLIGTALKEALYEVMVSYNSADAIQTIRDFRPHLVVLSLTMPQVSGLDVIEYIKTNAEAGGIPLIVLAHRDFTAEEVQALDGRIQAILNKGLLKEQDLARGLQEAIVKLSGGATEEGDQGGGSGERFPEEDPHRR